MLAVLVEMLPILRTRQKAINAEARLEGKDAN